MKKKLYIPRNNNIADATISLSQTYSIIYIYKYLYNRNSVKTQLCKAAFTI